MLNFFEFLKIGFTKFGTGDIINSSVYYIFILIALHIDLMFVNKAVFNGEIFER